MPSLEPPEQAPQQEESGIVSNKILNTIEEIEVLMILQDQTPMEEVGIPEEGATLDGGGNPGNPPPDGDHGSN